MELNDFGLIVKALRKNSFDYNGNRWTRESLSRAVHLTEDQLGRLERGDRKYLDNQTLMLLANSFNLTILERKEFFYAALGLKDEVLFKLEEPETQLSGILNTMEKLQVPAFLTDVYADIVSANKAVLDLYQINPGMLKRLRKTPAGFNQLYLIYSDIYGLKDLIGPQWSDAAIMTLLEFRRSSLRYRHTNYFHYLFNTLLKEKQFELDWYSCHRSHDNYDSTYERFEYEHPFFGPLLYTATETMIHTMQGELKLVLYNPANPETIAVFEELMKYGGTKIFQLAGWPEKKISN